MLASCVWTLSTARAGRPWGGEGPVPASSVSRRISPSTRGDESTWPIGGTAGSSASTTSAAPGGRVYGRKGGLAPGQFDLLGGIAVATDGRIYVTDSNENVVVSIDDMTGAGYSYFGYVANDSLFKQPTGISVDGASPIYVASENNAHVARFQDMQGVGYRTLGKSGSGEREFDRPIDVVVARIPK